MNADNQIIIYQGEYGGMHIEVRLANGSVWFTAENCFSVTVRPFNATLNGYMRMEN